MPASTPNCECVQHAAFTATVRQLWLQGFRSKGDGLTFYPTKSELVKANPPKQAVWAGTTYMNHEHRAVVKYTYFDNHQAFWTYLYKRRDMRIDLFEAIPEHKPRVLYFDLDG